MKSQPDIDGNDIEEKDIEVKDVEQKDVEQRDVEEKDIVFAHLSARELGVLAFNLTAFGFIFCNVHFESWFPVYVPGAYLKPQPHHVLAVALLLSGTILCLKALRHGVVLTSALALMLSGAIAIHVLNLRY